jgi:cell division protein ZapA (FtsZ GTPase activity inhibitor)|tara:strand:- start:187 stop:507 length:321 start_codon:yes stop_codon:yes gene_type:complete
MAEQVTVKITINGTTYPVTCIKGEEDRLIESSQEVNKVIEDLSSVSGMVGESRLLAMTSLILADKLIDNKKPIDTEFNNKEITEFINWFGKIATRMNKVAKLLENK